MRIVVTISFNSIAGVGSPAGKSLNAISRVPFGPATSASRHRRRDRRELGGRIEMAQGAADGAAIAGLAMADMHERLEQRRAALTRSENSRSRWRVMAPISSAPPVSRDVGEPLDAVEVDDVSGGTKRMLSIGISDWPPARSLALSSGPGAQRPRQGCADRGN